MRIKVFVYLNGIILLLLLSACQKENSSEEAQEPATGQLVLAFEHSVKDQPLNFTDQYVNDWGEQYTVSKLIYYVHGIKMVNSENETITLSPEYMLVNHEDSASRVINLTIPEGSYNELIFTLGVDSARNVSGAQTGALDPVHGMFWTWTSGYIMAKMEGHSPASTLANQVFTYHVGGFKWPYITVRPIHLPLATGVTIDITKDTLITVAVNADVDTWFSHVNPIRIADNPACHSPGQLANDIADNYEGMFSIRDVY